MASPIPLAPPLIGARVALNGFISFSSEWCPHCGGWLRERTGEAGADSNPGSCFGDPTRTLVLVYHLAGGAPSRQDRDAAQRAASSRGLFRLGRLGCLQGGRRLPFPDPGIQQGIAHRQHHGADEEPYDAERQQAADDPDQDQDQRQVGPRLMRKGAGSCPWCPPAGTRPAGRCPRWYHRSSRGSRRWPAARGRGLSGRRSAGTSAPPGSWCRECRR